MHALICGATISIILSNDMWGHNNDWWYVGPHKYYYDNQMMTTGVVFNHSIIFHSTDKLKQIMK